MEEDYKMFGLDRKTATISKAKKAYYNFSLLVHPDRNTCPDRTIACDEMHSVTTSYHRIIKDIVIEEKNRVLKECDDLSKRQDDELAYLDKFSKEMPSFMDIYLETHDDLKKFHEAWENRNEETKEMDYSMNELKGYDTIKSEYVGMSINDVKYSPDIELSNNFKPFVRPNTEIISINELGNPGDNSICFDYMEAHGTPSLLMDRLPKEKVEVYINPPNIEEEYDRKCKEMEQIYQ